MTDASFTLAHLSDVHVTPVRGFTPRHWNVKRLLGVLNWHRKRRFVHRPHVVEALLNDIRTTAPDHIVVSGDLINVGLPGEYQAAYDWLQSVGSSQGVSVVPGNHDIYVPLQTHPGVALWHDYMCGSDDQSRAERTPIFPYVRRFGPVALIGVNSAEPTRPGIAAGRVGPQQLGRLETILGELGREGAARIVIIHHPPLPGQSKASRALRDAQALVSVLEMHGAEAVLHGHNHTNTLRWLARETGRVPVLGVASGSAGKAHKEESLARYNLLTVSGEAGAWRLQLVARGFDAVDGDVVELERLDLTPKQTQV